MIPFGRFLATGFRTGYSPKAPGTMGTLVAIPLFLIVGLHPLVHAAFLVLIIAVSIPLSAAMEKETGKTDPQEVTIDEIAGFLLTMFLFDSPLKPGTDALNSSLLLIAGFILFRLFDIAKPFFIRRLQNLPGGWGVVMDDLGAGVSAWLILRFLNDSGIIPGITVMLRNLPSL